MKRIIIVFCVCFSLFSVAQEKIKFGISTGITYSGIYGNEFENKNSYDFDFLIGSSFEFPINHKLSFLTGLNYERKSFAGEILFNKSTLPPLNDPAFSSASGFTINSTLSFINIPLNLKYYIKGNESLFVDGGIFTAFLFTSKSNVAGIKTGNYNTLDFGINLGFGKKIKLNTNNYLNIEIRDSYGIVNVSKANIYNNGTMKTNSIVLLFNWEVKI